LGQVKARKLIISIAFLIIAGLMVKLIPYPSISHKTVSLKDALNNIKDWSNSGFNPLDKRIVEALHLDDYVNMSFSNGHETISLYVGYYLSNKKVGAAHDPLVCFPGQGWELTNRTVEKLYLTSLADKSISYTMMLGKLGNEKALIIYWFQAYDTANHSSFFQKLSLFFNRILNKGEDNALVRMTIPVYDQALPVYQEKINGFINVFYPVFIEHIKNGQVESL
jgi:EpsI family protein